MSTVEMAPSCRGFPSSQLPQEVQLNVQGRKRKMAGGADVDLGRCELLSLTQYTCSVEAPEFPGSPVVCWEVQRMFRRYVLEGGKPALRVLPRLDASRPLLDGNANAVV